jgi:hypothetical protein
MNFDESAMFAALEPKGFKAGDIVSRDGSDEQRVIEVYASGTMIVVECTKPPASGWCKIGDIEHNLSRRYELV